ncbi:MAG: N-(5'-phosphoribosyl)anthranilate isomerase [Flavobacteriaceae bacterium]|nr:N-(5'-phosphoribosyl)anthranilate isomerase [Flavobacteriaceae bacterium]
MKHNVAEVATLLPDYLGFIFYDKSPRNFEGLIPKIPSAIKKVGVFVNEKIDCVIEIATIHKLDIIQLHGEESPEYCGELSDLTSNLEIWKVFSIGETFNFDLVKPYENIVDKYLFDSKGKNKGGNGITFNWQILQQYPSKKPMILSGGIGVEEIDSINKLMAEEFLPIHAIDVNSKFEDRPGLKNLNTLKHFFDEL